MENKIYTQPVKEYRQFIVAITANLISFSAGTALGWTSPTMPKLQDKSMVDSPLDEPIEKNSAEEAWISSSLTIGATVGPLITIYFAEKFGRKWTLIFSAIFAVLSYVMMLVAKKVWIMILGRSVQGLSGGFAMSIIPMYLAEISTDNCRGATGSLMQVFLSGGTLFSYSIGPYVSYMALQIACLIIPFIFVICFFFMPESPYYFVRKGKRSEAIKSLTFLRGQSDQDVQQELVKIQRAVEEVRQNKGTVIDIFTNRGNLKAFIICIGLFASQQLSGIIPVLFNSQTIFENANSSLDPAVATIIIGGVQIFASVLTSFTVDQLGRKPILLVSSIGMSLSIIGLGVFFYIKSTGVDISSIAWLPAVLLIIFIFVYCFGFGPLPWAILGEMFPGNIKSIASAINASICPAIGFILTISFPTLNGLGPHYAYFLFGGFCVLSIFFVIFVVIETKGLSLEQIQDKLNGK